MGKMKSCLTKYFAVFIGTMAPIKIPKWFPTKFGYVTKPLSSIFYKLGHQIGKRPSHFIIITTLLYTLLATGFQRVHLITSPEYLYTPTNSDSQMDKQLINRLFPMDYTKNFDIGRKTKLGRYASLIFIPNAADNALTEEVFKTVKGIDEFVKRVKVYHQDRYWTYDDICAKADNHCYRNEYLFLAPKIAGNKTIRYPIQRDRDSVTYYPANIGGVRVDGSGSIISANAVRLLYFIDDSTERKDKLAMAWEEELSSQLSRKNFTNGVLTFWMTTLLENQFHNMSIEALPLLAGNVFIVSVFVTIACLGRDWVRSKPWIGLCGIVTSGFSTAAAFGIMTYFGLPYIDINLAIPFLLLGIGMDDTFVMLAAWSRTDRKRSVEERLAITYSEAAVSITITSVTNFISFLVGTITPFPCVYLFCAYAACSILFMYICQITFFGGCLVVAGRAESKNLHSVICIPIKHRSLVEHRNTLYKCFCTGGPSPESSRRNNSRSNEESITAKLFRDHLATALNKRPVKITVILLFFVYLFGAIWGCYNIRQGMEFHLLHPYDSDVIKYYKASNRYFNRYSERVQLILNQPLQYWNPEVQDSIERVLQAFENSSFVANSQLTESWLRYYIKLSKHRRGSIFFENFNLTNKDDFLEALQGAFFRIPAFKKFRNDIVFSTNGTEILATRFIIQIDGVVSLEEKKNMLIHLRGIAKSLPYDIKVYSSMFLFYDQLIIVANITIKSVVTAAVIMIGISFLFLPKFSCIVFVSLSVISIEIGVIGYMSFWNVNLDTISMINLIMCIGFSIDFVAHLSHAYTSCSDNESNENRMRHTLYSVGLPIVEGGISTALGVVLLTLIPAYGFCVFVKIVLLVVTFAVLHSIILLPVVFSLFGSAVGKTISFIGPEESLEDPQPTIDETEAALKIKNVVLVRPVSNSFLPTSYAVLKDDRRVLKRRLSSPANISYRNSFHEFTNAGFVPDVTSEVTLDETIQEVVAS